MGEHFKPDNVVQGRFRRSSRSWRKPEDYAALSAAARHDLLVRRKGERLSGTTIGIVLATAVCAGLAIGFSPAAPPPATSSIKREFGACKWGGGTNCVVDGDTIYLNGDKIRIAGIDAPETHDYGCPSELDLGEKAASRLQALLNRGGALSLTSIDRDEDVHGRKLRNVAVGGADVGKTLIGEGLARAYGGGRRSWCG